MGCDIHLYVEVKVKGKWHLYSTPRIQRDYDLFYWLAGVRGPREGVTQRFEPRGLPKNLSKMVKIDYAYDEPDAHSESWLNRQEIEELCEFASQANRKYPGMFEHEQLGYANGNPFSTIGEPDSGHPEEYEDCRIVFWFDN